MNIEKITQGKNLTDTEQTVLEYILDHLDTVQTEGVRGVARANYISTSTIMRLARKMDYSGFVDMCYKLRLIYRDAAPDDEGGRKLSQQLWRGVAAELQYLYAA